MKLINLCWCETESPVCVKSGLIHGKAHYENTRHGFQHFMHKYKHLFPFSSECSSNKFIDLKE